MPVDPCFDALLADKRSELRPPPPHVTVADMRAGNKAYLAATPKVALHAVDDVVIAGAAGPLTVRVYRPDPRRGLAVTLFCHGGGFVLGDLDTHDVLCRTTTSERSLRTWMPLKTPAATGSDELGQARAFASCTTDPHSPWYPAFPFTSGHQTSISRIRTSSSSCMVNGEP